MLSLLYPLNQMLQSHNGVYIMNIIVYYKNEAPMGGLNIPTSTLISLNLPLLFLPFFSLSFLFSHRPVFLLFLSPMLPVLYPKSSYSQMPHRVLKNTAVHCLHVGSLLITCCQCLS